MWKGKIFTSEMVKNGVFEKVKNRLDIITVNYHIKNNIIYFDEKELIKLPTYEKEYYIPYDDETGYSIYTIHEKDLI